MSAVLTRWAAALNRHLKGTDAERIAGALAVDPDLAELFGEPQSASQLDPSKRRALVVRLLYMLASVAARPEQAEPSAARSGGGGGGGGDANDDPDPVAQVPESNFLPTDMLALIYQQLGSQQRTVLLQATKKLRALLADISQTQLRKYRRPLAWRDGPRLHDELWAFYEACTLKHAVWNTNTMDPYLRYKWGRFSTETMEAERAFQAEHDFTPVAPLDHVHPSPALFFIDLLVYLMLQDDEVSSFSAWPIAKLKLFEPLRDLLAAPNFSAWMTGVIRLPHPQEITTADNYHERDVSKAYTRDTAAFLLAESSLELDIFPILECAKAFLLGCAELHLARSNAPQPGAEGSEFLQNPATEVIVLCKWIHRIDMLVQALQGPLELSTGTQASVQYDPRQYISLWQLERDAALSEARLLARCVLHSMVIARNYRQFPVEASADVNNPDWEAQWYNNPFKVFDNTHSSNNYSRLVMDTENYFRDEPFTDEPELRKPDLSAGKVDTFRKFRWRVVWITRALSWLQVDLTHKLARLSDAFSRHHPDLGPVRHKTIAACFQAGSMPSIQDLLDANPGDADSLTDEESVKLESAAAALRDYKKKTEVVVECAMARFCRLGSLNGGAGGLDEQPTLVMLLEPSAILQWWIPQYANQGLARQHLDLYDIDNMLINVTADEVTQAYLPVVSELEQRCSVTRAVQMFPLQWDKVLMSEIYRDAAPLWSNQITHDVRVAWLYCTLGRYTRRTTYMKYDLDDMITDEEEDIRILSWRENRLRSELFLLAVIPPVINGPEPERELEEWLEDVRFNGVRPSAAFVSPPQDVQLSGVVQAKVLSALAIYVPNEDVDWLDDYNRWELADQAEFNSTALIFHKMNCFTWP